MEKKKPVTTEVITELQRLRDRTERYSSIFPDFPEELIKDMTEREQRALDKAITFIKFWTSEDATDLIRAFYANQTGAALNALRRLLDERMKGESEKEKLESAILVLEDIKKALESEEPVDSFITRWVRYNPEIPGVYEKMRSCYAENVGNAITDVEKYLLGR